MRFPGKMILEVLSHLFKKPATDAYPFEKPELPATFRGQIRFIAHKCVGCKLCVKDCPAEALTITQVGPKENKQFEATFLLDQCMYCGQCVESCNKEALEATVQFELAQFERDKLKVTFRAAPESRETKPPVTPPSAQS